MSTPQNPRSRKKRETLKFVSSAEARADLSELAIEAQDLPVVVLRHGKPHALLTGIKGKRIGELHDVTFTALKTARDSFFALAQGAQEKPAVILKFEKPFAMLTGLDGKTIEEVMREHEKAKAK